MIENSKPDTGDTADKYGCKYDFTTDSCSTMECTGLMHAAPQSDAEVEHYNQVFRFLPEHASDPEE